ncbi:MAG: protein-disulfide reductase DsbD domain-containing protein, partial [Bacteroidota bacterium]|nr:protein-disulfide reductase DsbD domain-containing protein [Bacteroidota bacterium]
MIKYGFLLVTLLISLTGNAQAFGPSAGAQNPAQWTAQVDKTSESEYTLLLNASIEPEWHVYSQFTDPGGSLPLELEFLEAGKAYSLEGPTVESETTTAYSEIFEVDETFFSETAQLSQKIIAEETTEYVKLILKYQVCKEVCINEEKYIVFDLVKENGKVFKDFNDFQAYGKVQEEVEKIEPVKEVVKKEEKQDLWTIFFVAFASGFLALLTPCVFPMIPMTVSFFTKQSKNLAVGRRNAILYGIFIVVIYVLLGSLVTGIFGADALNALSTNVWFNLVFFLLLVVFAISFFGAFEIMLPNSWANAVDRKADRGGIIGIF